MGDVGIEEKRKAGIMEDEKRGKAGRRKEGNLEWWKDGVVQGRNARWIEGLVGAGENSGKL